MSDMDALARANATNAQLIATNTTLLTTNETVMRTNATLMRLVDDQRSEIERLRAAAHARWERQEERPS